jgi:hypothetical protein
VPDYRFYSPQIVSDTNWTDWVAVPALASARGIAYARRVGACNVLTAHGRVTLHNGGVLVGFKDSDGRFIALEAYTQSSFLARVGGRTYADFMAATLTPDEAVQIKEHVEEHVEEQAKQMRVVEDHLSAPMRRTMAAAESIGKPPKAEPVNLYAAIAEGFTLSIRRTVEQINASNRLTRESMLLEPAHPRPDGSVPVYVILEHQPNRPVEVVDRIAEFKDLAKALGRGENPPHRYPRTAAVEWIQPPEASPEVPSLAEQVAAMTPAEIDATGIKADPEIGPFRTGDTGGKMPFASNVRPHYDRPIR